MRRKIIAVLFAALSGLFLAMPRPANADQFGLEDQERWWAEGGFGGARVLTTAPGLPGWRGAVVLSAGFGVHATEHFGIGFEYASSAALSSCAHWDCGGQSWNFKPNFNRATVFGELRMFQGRLRMRYGFGDNSFCYGGGPGFSLWYLAIEAMEDDDEFESASCAARHGTVRTASISYHWRWMEEAEPVTAGLRLGVERGDFRARQSIGMPAFGYRAVTLTLQLSFN